VNEPSKAVAVNLASVLSSYRSSSLLPLLTETKDDRVYTNNDSRAIARGTPLAPRPPSDNQQQAAIVSQDLLLHSNREEVRDTS
jgi:hypothetical protein